MAARRRRPNLDGVLAPHQLGRRREPEEGHDEDDGRQREVAQAGGHRLDRDLQVGDEDPDEHRHRRHDRGVVHVELAQHGEGEGGPEHRHRHHVHPLTHPRADGLADQFGEDEQSRDAEDHHQAEQDDLEPRELVDEEELGVLAEEVEQGLGDGEAPEGEDHGSVASEHDTRIRASRQRRPTETRRAATFAPRSPPGGRLGPGRAEPGAPGLARPGTRSTTLRRGAAADHGRHPRRDAWVS